MPLVDSLPTRSSAVYFQRTASPMITATTTSDMIVSCSIAYGWNGFPRCLTSSLYCWNWRRRVSRRVLTGTRPPRARLDESGARAVRAGAVLRVGRPAAGRVLRPRRRGDAEADDEVEVQPDQRRDRAREQQHV